MRKSLFFGLVAVLGLIGCSRNQEVDVPDANLSLFARTESPAESRTVVESGVHVYWEPGDEIAVFMGEKAAKFTTDITAASGTATFKGTFGDQGWPEELDLWAVYPFSEDAVFDGETITTTLPSEQVAREGSFGKDMNLAIAHSNSSTLQFYNVGGGIRFSVTEEGIRKVMFEGLSGEIISGKIKIGLDESGKPVVKEVTGGSQFITLLPPSGQETFQPGTWYYIVAIPGSLEGGYKLRFYKNSDYARKVSEKAVEIKRSIFGSLEKADSGIEYGATTTHFPVTIEEIKESAKALSAVNDEVWKMLQGVTVARPSIVDEIRSVEGVLNVITDPSQKTIAVMQKDSVWINYFLDKEESPYAGLMDTSNNAPTSAKQRRDNRQHSVRGDNVALLTENSYFNKKRNAIILAPYSFDYDIQGFKTKLIHAGVGYTEADMVVKQQDIDSFVLSDFYGSNLSKFDIIMIISHGGIGCNVYQQEDMPLATIIDTGIPYSDEAAEKLINSGEVSFDKIAYSGDKGHLTFAMTSDFLKDASFDNACVFLMTCHSAERLDDEGSLVKAFLDKKAGLVSGNNRTVHSTVTSRINLKIVDLMTKGLSFRQAFHLIEESEHLNAFCNMWYEYVRWFNEKNKKEFSPEDNFDVANFYVIKENESLTDKEYFLVNPFPSLNTPEPQEGNMRFSWNCSLNSFSHSWEIPDENVGWRYPEETYNVKYEVFIDNNKLEKDLYPDDTVKQVFWEPSFSGKHQWRVVAKIMKGDSVIASYQSDEGYFIIKEEYKTPDAKDLGLSVKWASFNLGASIPEMPGYFFAWGETEPYYYDWAPFSWKEGKEAGYDWPSYKWCNGSSSSITKYNTSALTQLEPGDDAAHVNLGDRWRIPTEDEWAELRNNCSFTWTTLNGVNGLLVTSLKPGYTNVSIFLPAAGVVGNKSLYYLGESGFYWTSGSNTSIKENAGYNTFETGSSGLGYGWIDRCYGLSIRPVYGDQAPPTTGDIEGTEEDPWN